MKSRYLILLCLLPSLFLAGCGGGDDNSGDGAEKEIAAAVESVLGDLGPVDCRRLMTPRFLEQTKRDTGKSSLESCEEDAGEASTESVVVGNISVEGSTAEVHATYTEGPIKGETLLIGLVERDDRWKLDEVVGFVNLDKAKTIGAIQESLTESTEGAKPKVVACISSKLARVPTRKLEEAFVSAPKLELLLLEAAKSCGASPS